MSHTLAVSTLLLPRLADVRCTFTVFMDVGSKLEDISRDESSSFVAYIASLKDDLRWLRLFELPDSILSELHDRLRLGHEETTVVEDAIADTLKARDEFRRSTPEESLMQALRRNKIRTDLEAEFGHSLYKQAAYSWAAGRGKLQEIAEVFEGFFADVEAVTADGHFDPKPILLCAIGADRIV